MAEVTQLKRYDARPINWGKWFLIGIGMLVSAFILLVPMIYIFVQAFSKGLMPVLQNLADPDMLHAIWLTVMIALIAVPVNLVFGILLALALDYAAALMQYETSPLRRRVDRKQRLPEWR